MGPKEFDKELAAALWNRIQLTTNNHRLYPKQHSQHVLFVGYADFKIAIDSIPFLCLPGNSIKLFGNQIYFDPKSEQARDGSIRYFPMWFPALAEGRAVLNEQLKRDLPILRMCREALQVVKGTSPVLIKSDPF